MFYIAILLWMVPLSKAIIVEEECLNYTVYPVQYDLNIIPYTYFVNPYYMIDLTITVIANAPNVNIIELDCRDMEVLGDTVRVLDGTEDIVNRPRPFEVDKTNGKIYIYLRESLKIYTVNDAHFYYVKITVIKHMKEESEGAFLVKYDYDNAKDKNFLYMTRLSPNKAKYFFPCFDNPRFEAVFKFRVYVIEHNTALQYTNSSLVIAEELKRDVLRENNTIIEYLPSPQVALHQVGFHVSQFSHIQAKSKYTNDIIKVWAPQKLLVYYDYILHFAVTIVDLIHEYSTIKRPLLQGSINIASVPKIMNGYEIGSWNLLTNGLNRLENFPRITSIKQKEQMSFELAQQLSRIWLGNPGEAQRTRWKEEWLKEGMATYLAYYFLAQFNEGASRVRFPLRSYGVQMTQKAMSHDWHHSTPALETFNTSLAIEIPSRYKDLVTMKTGAIMWMLENWIGSEKFHYALVKYIHSRRGKYISLHDFTSNLDIDTVECLYQFFNGSTASRILKSWFHQPGYPVINVHVLRDRVPNAIQLKQKKFSFTHDYRMDSDYLIPISYLIQNNNDCYNCYQPRFTIDKQTYTFGENLKGGWIILNTNATGYYRVNYDPITWRLIAKTLKENPEQIGELNRAQIVNDVFALYVAGDLDMDLAMEVLDFLDMERSPTVWASAINGFELLSTDKASCNMTVALYNECGEFMQRKVSKIYKELINKDNTEDKDTQVLRSDIVEFACALNYVPCLNYARSRYSQQAQGGRWLDPDTRAACFYVAENDSKGKSLESMSSLFEKEDKITASYRLRDKKRFLIRTPLGVRRPITTVSTDIPMAEYKATTPIAESYAQPRDSSIAVQSSLLTLVLALTLLFVR